ncbi:MAG TPA: hypothetical protein VNZ48_00430 [Xanthobacteraceae bacterium]|jgi:hypothetical protein|nr:hypothetical protein [Xanthobacteraceae bacterium]
MIQPIEKHASQSLGRWLEGWQSENIGGLVSMAGSCLFLLGGDTSGFIVTASFLVAEIILARSGHTRSGYSIGCALFSFGDALAVTSNVAAGNNIFQILLAIMAATWAIGALRGPLAWYGARHDNSSIVRFADALQPLAGALTLALRLPGMIAAVSGGNSLGAAAVACWGLADILLGRLQDTIRRFRSGVGLRGGA